MKNGKRINSDPPMATSMRTRRTFGRYKNRRRDELNFCGISSGKVGNFVYGIYLLNMELECLNERQKKEVWREMHQSGGFELTMIG